MWEEKVHTYPTQPNQFDYIEETLLNAFCCEILLTKTEKPEATNKGLNESVLFTEEHPY